MAAAHETPTDEALLGPGEVTTLALFGGLALAAVTVLAVRRIPCATASTFDSPRSTSSLIRLTMNTW